VNYYSIETSMHIAIERGQTFEGFEHSTYADGSYFDRYLDEAPDRDISDKVVDLFCGAAYDFVPSREDWRRLRDAVMYHGLYHAYRMAIAPTQSISYVQNATSSVMPIVDQIEVRKQGDSTTYYPMPYMTASNYFYYKSAYKMDQRAVIDMVATIQRHVDQGISCILHVNSDITTRELGRYYAYAHHRKLKSLYYTRTNLLSVEECTSCAV